MLFVSKCNNNVVTSCIGCNKTHKKNDSFKSADNKTDDSFIHSFRRDLFEDLKNKLKSTAELMKSLFQFYLFHEVVDFNKKILLLAKCNLKLKTLKMKWTLELNH